MPRYLISWMRWFKKKKFHLRVLERNVSSFNLVSYMLTWSLAELNFGCCANGNTFMFWDAMMSGKRSSQMACQFGKANVWCSFLITYICIIHIMLCGKIIIKSRHFYLAFIEGRVYPWKLVLKDDATTLTTGNLNRYIVHT